MFSPQMFANVCFLTEIAEQLEVERTQAHPCPGKVATLSLEGMLSVRNEFRISRFQVCYDSC